MKLTIWQKPENGILGGPKSKWFSAYINEKNFDIEISQNSFRIIKIHTDDGTYSDVLSLYYALETLLVLFDGQFYPVTKADDGTEITTSWKKRIPIKHTSADYMMGAWNRLIDFEEILDESILLKWYELEKELDLIHNMVLFCLSNADAPIDIKCAFMIEAYEGICELIHARDQSFILPSVKGKESKLKKYFLSVAEKYGFDIFGKELTVDKERFAQILVNTRNRIAHIKRKQDRQYLNGEECVQFMIKLSLLYRVVIFNLLGIPVCKYYKGLNSQVKRIDECNIMREFISTLNVDSQKSKQIAAGQSQKSI